MHRHFDIAILDVVLMALGPPLLGAALGLLVSWRRSRPLRAALGAAVGGAGGAWVGLAIYRLTILPTARDHSIFEALVLGGLLLGALPAAWLLAGPARTTTSRPSHVADCSTAIVGILISCLGLIPYQLGSERSSFIPVSEENKDLGIIGLLVGLAILVAGLLLVRVRNEN
ncbi:MAG: hypothetical protein FJ271_19320 [Planctomycetes bacterium]|nr:hypothetical protein [Planctomycetota bacterium]